MATLYSYPESFRTKRILIAAALSNTTVNLPDDFVFGDSNKKPEFTKKFPLGRVPALTTKDGQNLSETNAIVEYVSSDKLRGSDAISRALIRQWQDFADGSLLQPVMTLMLQAKELMTPPKDVVAQQRKDFDRYMQFLNQSLNGKKVLVGSNTSSADISVFTLVLEAFTSFAGKDIRGKYPNVMKWFMALQSDAAIKKVLGAVKLVDLSPGVEAPEKKKKEKPKPQEAKPKKEQPKKVEEEPAEAPKEKSKDPLATCPPGTFDLEDFKRYYSNNDEDKSVEYFWQKFDPENYSIWYCEYKYPEDLTKVFMSCNLIGGFLQRLDKLHKYAFASMGLFGTDDNSTISGVWVWRGHELVFPLSPNWQVDYASYDWKKLDLSDAKNKNLVNEYLKWEGDFNGKKFNQGKIFK